MPRDQRVAIFKQIEEKNESHVITYITGDRQPFGARIAEDAVRILYNHLLKLDSSSKRRPIHLFLYSRGGDVSVPLVQQEIARQSPIAGIEGRMYGGKWKEKTGEKAAQAA